MNQGEGIVTVEPAAPVMIRIEGLNKWYGDFQALRDIDLTVRLGEKVVVGGLEVMRRDGTWVTAHPIEDTFVVNVGDLLARWTNDAFRSTPHRVVNRAGRERYSLVVAWDPDFETVIDPGVVCRDGATPKHPPVTCGDYVLSRFDAAFAYRRKT